MKRLPSIETDTVQLEVVECNCGYHMTFDTSFLDQVVNGGAGEVDQICPSCLAAVTYIIKQDGEDEIQIRTREELKAREEAAEAAAREENSKRVAEIMERDAPPRHKTAKLVKDYEVTFKGWKLVVPTGTTVSNKTECGFNDNYRFANRFDGLPDGAFFDFDHYGINVPAEYCEPYEENNYVGR